MCKKIFFSILLLILFQTNVFAVACACFYLEYPEDAGMTIMEDYADLTTEVGTVSLYIYPYAIAMEGAFYEVEKKHRSSVKNINMGVIENRESLKLMTKGVAQREVRKDIECQVVDTEIELIESKILYLEELLVEVSIESNKRIAHEKNILLGK